MGWTFLVQARSKELVLVPMLVRCDHVEGELFFTFVVGFSPLLERWCTSASFDHI